IELPHERGDDVDGLMEEVGDEDLAADVQVQTVARDRCRRACPLDRLRRVAGRDAEAELRIGLTRTDELVGVRLDAGRDANQHARSESVVVMQRVETVELVERVHDERGAGTTRSPQLVYALLVAVEV